MTLNFGESPSVARESTLSQILEANVPEKYYLSARACEGILRRAERRGKALPPILKEALLQMIERESDLTSTTSQSAGTQPSLSTQTADNQQTMPDQPCASLTEEPEADEDSPKSGETREGTAEAVKRCAGGSCAVGSVGAFMGGQGAAARGIGWSDSVAPTIKSVASGSNQVPDVVYTLEGNTVDRNSSKNGRGWSEGVTPTLNTQDRHAVAIDCRNFKENFEVSGTLQAKSNGGYSLNYQNPIVYSSSSHGSLSEGVGTIGTGTRAVHEMVAVYDTTQITSPSNYSKPKPGDACHPLAAQQHPPLAVYPERTGALCANSHPGSYTGQDAFNDMLPVILSEKPPRKYIVRRLTPLECCRLQGFPDWWMDDVEGSDSAKYKMWGNGIALPCAVDVLSRLEKV